MGIQKDSTTTKTIQLQNDNTTTKKQAISANINTVQLQNFNQLPYKKKQVTEKYTYTLILHKINTYTIRATYVHKINHNVKGTHVLWR